MKILFIISWIIVAVLWTCCEVAYGDCKWKDILLRFFGVNLCMYAFAAIIVFITVLIKFGISITF